jgi:hypothetical protein
MQLQQQQCILLSCPGGALEKLKALLLWLCGLSGKQFSNQPDPLPPLCFLPAGKSSADIFKAGADVDEPPSKVLQSVPHAAYQTCESTNGAFCFASKAGHAPRSIHCAAC